MACGDSPDSAGEPGASMDQSPPPAEWSFTRVDSAATGTISFVPSREVQLGEGKAASSANISRVIATGEGFFVIEGGAPAVVHYDRKGRHRFTIAIAPGKAGKLKTPRALAYRGDTLFVLDLDYRRGIAMFDGVGAHIGTIDLQVGSSAFDLSASPTSLAIATIAQDAEIRDGAATMLWFVSAGRAVRDGKCAPDPIYQRSLEQRGFFELFRAVGVSSFGGRTYCRQPVSPVVQVFSDDGAPMESIRLAPPFYVRGPDAPQSMNQLMVDRFSATWTEHRNFFPFQDGFVSVYSNFDTLTSTRRYRLFRCAGVSGPDPRCAVGSITDVPLDFLAPDTLLVLRATEDPLAPPRLALLHLR